ncbi:hypothetical protein ACSNOH_03435, partial [Streptomyces sp. URMC 127]
MAEKIAAGEKPPGQTERTLDEVGGTAPTLPIELTVTSSDTEDGKDKKGRERAPRQSPVPVLPFAVAGSEALAVSGSGLYAAAGPVVLVAAAGVVTAGAVTTAAVAARRRRKNGRWDLGGHHRSSGLGWGRGRSDRRGAGRNGLLSGATPRRSGGSGGGGHFGPRTAGAGRGSSGSGSRGGGAGRGPS